MGHRRSCRQWTRSRQCRWTSRWTHSRSRRRASWGAARVLHEEQPGDARELPARLLPAESAQRAEPGGLKKELLAVSRVLFSSSTRGSASPSSRSSRSSSRSPCAPRIRRRWSWSSTRRSTFSSTPFTLSWARKRASICRPNSTSPPFWRAEGRCSPNRRSSFGSTRSPTCRSRSNTRFSRPSSRRNGSLSSASESVTFSSYNVEVSCVIMNWLSPRSALDEWNLQRCWSDANSNLQTTTAIKWGKRRTAIKLLLSLFS